MTRREGLTAFATPPPIKQSNDSMFCGDVALEATDNYRELAQTDRAGESDRFTYTDVTPFF